MFGHNSLVSPRSHKSLRALQHEESYVLCDRNHSSKRKVLKMYELATYGNVEFRQMPNFLQQFVRIVSFEQL